MDTDCPFDRFEQFFASLGDFNRDLRRESGRRIGFDANIVNRFGEFFNDDGSLSNVCPLPAFLVRSIDLLTI